jgi:RNA polymerase sigma factor (sigma-70 family)
MTTKEREQLVLDYLPLANKLAWTKNNRTPRSVTIDELKSAAYFGLVDAASRYKPKYGVAFGPFARFRICGEMADYLRELSWGKRQSIQMVSIDESNGNQGSWADTLRCPVRCDPNDFFDLVTESLADLGKRIVKMYYVDRRTLREIGTVEGLSESRISQLLSKYRDLIRSELDNEKTFFGSQKFVA